MSLVGTLSLIGELPSLPSLDPLFSLRMLLMIFAQAEACCTSSDVTHAWTCEEISICVCEVTRGRRLDEGRGRRKHAGEVAES